MYESKVDENKKNWLRKNKNFHSNHIHLFDKRDLFDLMENWNYSVVFHNFRF